MTPTYKEYVFDFADLKLLSAVCLNCHAETIFDMTTAFNKVPKSCPFCYEDFSPFFTEALTAFYTAYKQFTAQNAKASARIRIRRELTVSEF
ncbi:MAG: hypothetical protein ABSF79_11480 [Smithellaceae bacterium]|jgi:hypothetical protein